MEILRDATSAGWPIEDVDWWRCVTIGPAGFEAYARLRLIPDPEHPGQSENDVEVPDDHPQDIDQIRRLVELLSPWTSTPHDAFFAVWDGWPWSDDLRAAWGEPVLDNDHRRFIVLHGALHELRHWEVHTAGDGYPPAFIWPADRAWCVTFDVDPHWAGIGARREAVDALLSAGSSDLDIVETTRDEDHPFYF